MATQIDLPTKDNARISSWRRQARLPVNGAELAGLALFRSVTIDDLAPLLRDCEVRDVADDEVLIEAGQPNDRLYLLLSGELGVHLEAADSTPIAIVQAGEAVGELSLIDKRPTSAFVVARAPSRVLVLSEGALWAMVTASHAVSVNLLRILSTRLRSDHALICQHRKQLREAQRLEALGHLTGGIAHDFNNLLALATINLETIAELARGDDRILELAQEARCVLQNGAELTQRLLAFSRRQHLETRTVDINALLTATSALLRRFLGDGIDVKTRPTREPCQARVDPSQLQNALLNLALNARDAMPDGGTLTLATANRSLARPEPASGLAAGLFAVVTVDDTGHGMAPEILERAFEPLFTTKDAETGTGLGLSMVYGFAKQSGGHVTLRSKVGRGTKVALYLPVPGSHAEQCAAGRCQCSVSGEVRPPSMRSDLSGRDRPAR